MRLQEYLAAHRLITDGAMGTYYEKKYMETNPFPECDNLTRPERIREIHLEYLYAGARLLRTNTFATNPTFFDNMEEIIAGILAGYRIAEEAVAQFREESGCEDEIFIAADFGPIGEIEEQSTEELLADYRAMIDAFFECGAQIFLFETQHDDKYVKLLADEIKARDNDAFVWVNFTFDMSGYTRAGLSVKRVNLSMAADDSKSIDAYGYNCGMEAGHLYQMLAAEEVYCDKYLAALPNAGYPLNLRGKTIYTENEGYFVSKSMEIAGLGVDICGGCCGTSPSYIKDLNEALTGVKKQKRTIRPIPETVKSMEMDTIEIHDTFMEKLNAGKQPILVELDPPFLTDVNKVMDGAVRLRDAGVDLLTLSDSPMARARMDAGALAARIIREAGIMVMPHLTCRDRNVIGLRSTLLGHYLNKIRHLLLVTGDPVARDARGNTTGVFDMNSIRLMEYVKNLNSEIDSPDIFHFGGALNYHGANPDAIIRRMEKKIDNGCEFFLTQPIYSDEDIERIAYIKSRIDGRAKICCGIMPLVSYKNAMFIHNEMAGIHIPQDVLVMYRPDMTREEAQEVAIELSLSLVERLRPVADAYYFMTPFNRAELIEAIVRKMHTED
ncbi:MAG: bifunctional homocysteine S-methyltransferase/methylenetetrahydrofolate reductase [bacterium]|nr:bifunctional homocysteine S-methyltransferase/methylenetetrahydrofolate reductase [bacterium]